MNKEIANKEKWNENVVQERETHLQDIILKSLWKGIQGCDKMQESWKWASAGGDHKPDGEHGPIWMIQRLREPQMERAPRPDTVISIWDEDDRVKVHYLMSKKSGDKPQSTRLDKSALHIACESNYMGHIKSRSDEIEKKPQVYGFLSAREGSAKAKRARKRNGFMIWDQLLIDATKSETDIGVLTTEEMYLRGRVRRFDDWQIEMACAENVHVTVFRVKGVAEFVSDVDYCGEVREWSPDRGVLRSTSNRRKTWQRVGVASNVMATADAGDVHIGYFVKFKIRVSMVDSQPTVEAREVTPVSNEPGFV